MADRTARGGRGARRAARASAWAALAWVAAACGGATTARGARPDAGGSAAGVAATTVDEPEAGGVDENDAGGSPGATSDRGSCGAYTSGIAACDQCIRASQCCATALACDTPDEGGVDDAGRTRCEDLLSCLLVCVSGGGDAGVAPPPSYGACKDTCSAAYDSAEQLDAVGLDMCVGLFCSDVCPIAR